MEHFTWDFLDYEIQGKCTGTGLKNICCDYKDGQYFNFGMY